MTALRDLFWSRAWWAREKGAQRSAQPSLYREWLAGKIEAPTRSSKPSCEAVARAVLRSPKHGHTHAEQEVHEEQDPESEESRSQVVKVRTLGIAAHMLSLPVYLGLGRSRPSHLTFFCAKQSLVQVSS